jgi:hypothetical protein
MRPLLDIRTIGGMLAVLAALLLATPGVKAVRAEERKPPLASSEGPACNPTDPEMQALQAGANLQQIQAGLLARIAAEGGSPAEMPILLNGRGYNYSSRSDLERIAAEAQRLETRP